MKANRDLSILDEVRAIKEAKAAKFNYDVVLLMRDAQERQESSGHEIIRERSQLVFTRSDQPR